MDVVAPKRRGRAIFIRSIFVGVLLSSVVVIYFWSSPEAVSFNDVAMIELAPATFVESVQFRGIAVPKESIYLEAEVAGRVARLLVTEGQTLRANEQVLSLKNDRLTLEVTSRDAQVAEQINALRNTKLAMERDFLDLRNDEIQYLYQLERLDDEIKRTEKLSSDALLAEIEISDLIRERKYIGELLALNKERQNKEMLFRTTQIHELEQTIERLERQMKVTGTIVESLSILSPIDGYLSSLEVEVGEQLAIGSRIGIVDSLKGYRIEMKVPEFYSSQFRQKLTSHVIHEGDSYRTRIQKVLPEVLSGQFHVELTFLNEVPASLSKGQSVGVEVQFEPNGDEVLKIESRYVHGEGNEEWVFVFSPRDRRIVKRDVVSGRRTSGYIELVAGVSAGEVLVDVPEQFAANKEIVLNDE